MKIYYILDPMCSWCWAFKPSWLALVDTLPADTEIQYVMGGLAADSDQPMATAMQNQLQQIWHHIAEQTGTKFNFSFWTDCKPRRSTYPACRAVIAAGFQGNQYVEAMITAIQHAYYLNARNPSDDDTLISLANSIDLNLKQFERDFHGAEVKNKFSQDLHLTHTLGIQGFPAVVGTFDNHQHLLSNGYCESSVLINRVNQMLTKAKDVD